MANMVTRTIKTTKAIIIGADMVNNALVEYEEILPRTYKDDKAILKAVSKKQDENSTVKAVAVKSVVIEDTLYGMDEELFIANAKVLPPRKDYTNNDEK